MRFKQTKLNSEQDLTKLQYCTVHSLVPGARGKEEERLVHTVRACVKIPRNLGETVNYSILLSRMSSVPRSQDMSVK